MCLPACRSHLARLCGRPDRTFTGLGIVDQAGAGGGSAPAPDSPCLIAGPARHIVDLTHPLDPDFPTYVGEPQLAIRTTHTLANDGWNVREWTINEHTGTHLDAPFHRSTGLTADALPATSLIGPLAVIDLRARAEADPDSQVTVDDLRDWERRHGRLPDGAIVALHSAWDTLARTARFRGADTSGTLHFPGFHADAAAFLLESRRVKGLVVDTLSLDHGPSTEFPVHTLWLGSGRWGLEAAANLGRLPPTGATLIVGVPRVTGASGGPARVFALH